MGCLSSSVNHANKIHTMDFDYPRHHRQKWNRPYIFQWGIHNANRFVECRDNASGYMLRVLIDSSVSSSPSSE